MESFYGGRKGTSFVIVRTFDGIDIPQPEHGALKTTYTGNFYAVDENNKFKIAGSGPVARTEENVGSYPDWKYHLNDGSFIEDSKTAKFPIERAQGMKQFFEDKTTIGEVGYGEYVIIDTIVNMHQYSNVDNAKIYRRGMDHQAENGGAEYVGQILGPMGDTPTVEMDTVSNIRTEINNLGDKKTGYNTGFAEYTPVSGQTNNKIKYAWVEIKNGFGNTEGVKLGFEFPYTVFDFTAESISAYATKPTVTRTNSDTTPYYYQLKLGIPKGIHGTDVSNIRIADSADGKGKAFWYTEKDYSSSTTKTTNKEIGPYKVINGVSVADDGTIRITFTHGDMFEKAGAIKWIKDIALAANGTLTVSYNNGTSKTFTNALKSIDDISLANNGTLTVDYNNGESKGFTNALRSITGTNVGTDGTLTVNYNNGNPDSYSKVLKAIKNITLGTDGALTVNYNTGDSTTFSQKINWIDEASLSSKGALKISFNNSNIADITQTIKWVSSMTVDTGSKEGEGTQKLSVTYNTGATEKIGNPINYIIETVVTGEDAVNYGANPYHLLVLYADKNKRGTVTYPSQVFGANRTDWKDLGYIRGEVGGLRIIGDFDTIDSLKNADGTWKTPDKVAGYTTDRIGWGYTIAEEAFYLYDYNRKIWYEVGGVAARPKNFVAMETSSSATLDLLTGGLWFVVEESKSIE